MIIVHLHIDSRQRQFFSLFKGKDIHRREEDEKELFRMMYKLRTYGTDR